MKGFTLVEVLVVLGLLLAVVLIAVFTFFSSSPNTVLRAAVEQVASDVRLAQDLAMSERVRYSILFTAGSATYHLRKWDSGTSAWVAATGTETPSSLPNSTAVQSVADITAGTIIFDSLGSPYEGAGTGAPLVGSGAGGLDHIVISSGKVGRTGDVAITPGTGMVEVAW